MKHIIISLCMITPLFSLTGCQSMSSGLGTVAQNGNGGSLDGAYNLSDIWVTSVNGGRAGFGYGAVNGYPGKSASIGIGVPRHIKGYWAKENEEGPGFQSYYRISADIDSVLAEKKIRTLQNYYQTFKSNWGRMQVEVEQSRLMVLYTQGCYDNRVDCSVRENADPNGYVIRSPSDTIDVVALFDGQGESSLTPFPGSPYDERRVLVEPFRLANKITLTDTEGNTATNGRVIGDLTRIQGDWVVYEKTTDPTVFIDHYFHIDAPIDANIVKEKIQIMRKGLAHKYFGTVTYTEIDEDGNIKIYYRLICTSNSALCDSLEESRASPFIIRSSDYDLDILLFEGKAEELDAPYEKISDRQ
ncbi:hypothetical protein A8139_02165 [Marinomonas primoryensis]|uniref:Uncharacterized protein n=1 Tax=Marinomonas primoryensis TaxID=178399 RepID=A0A2Z4PN64_9GAMM|nr:hypothetical protein A8139_02165 [Marinomonas primoryensis]